MSSLRNPLRRTAGLFQKCHTRRQFSGPPPTYPANNPIHISPAALEKRSPLQTFLKWCVAGAFVGLPSYWIFFLGQKVSIPYCIQYRGAGLMVDVGRLDAFQTHITEEQKGVLARTMVEAAVEEIVTELKESIGLPFQIDGLPGSFKIRAPKIDPTRIIYRLDISRAGISRSQRTFNPADITSSFLNKDILPDSKDGEVGYKSMDDVREGYVLLEGMVKVTGPKEMGGKMGTVEFAGVINVETAEIVQLRKVVLRVMGQKIDD